MCAKLAKGINDLKTWCEKTSHTDILLDWDYSKNDNISPDGVTVHSGKKVWWRCNKCGFEWNSSISSRSQNHGCRQCAAYNRQNAFKKAILERTGSLSETNPEIAAEWHPTKNGDLKPNNISPGSNKKVWWIGKCGHEWASNIVSRVHGSGCPYCAGKQVLVGFNDLATVNPSLADEWDYEKNEPLTPSQVRPFTNKRVWWKCKKGHSWYALISGRSNGYGCPYCTPAQTSMPEQGIIYYLRKCSDIVSREKINGKEVDVFCPKYMFGIEYDGYYYHKDKSEKDEVKKKSVQKAGIRLFRVIESDSNIIADNDIHYKKDDMGPNYEWALRELCKLLSEYTNDSCFVSLDINVKRDKLDIRKNYDETSKQESLAAKYPQLAKEWNYEKNKGLSPDMFPGGSHEIVWWRCSEGHEWKSDIHNRTGLGNGCPFCAGQRAIFGENDLLTCDPALAKEWNYDKNGELSPRDVAVQSNKSVWWICDKQHYWKAKISDRHHGNGCPYCSNHKVWVGYNDLQTVNSTLVKEWNFEKNVGISPTEFTEKSGRKVWWRCPKGHEWEAQIRNRTMGTGCPYCYKESMPKIQCVETGEIFNSLLEAATYCGIKERSNFSAACKNPNKKVGGYHWKYVE